MKKILLFVVVALAVAACQTSRSTTASAIGLVPLNNYFVPLNSSFDTGYTYKVITSQSEFEKDVKVSDQDLANAEKPDFSGQSVVAVIHNGGPNQRKQIVLDGASFRNDELFVYYHISGTETSPVTTYLPGLGLGTVPKVRSVRRASFYQDSVLVRTVPVNIY